MGTEGLGDLGDGSPQRGPGAEPRFGFGVEAPEARYIQTICSCQMLFYAGLLPSPSSISLPPPKKNSSDLRESHDPARPGQGGHVSTLLPVTGFPLLRRSCHKILCFFRMMNGSNNNQWVDDIRDCCRASLQEFQNYTAEDRPNGTR